MGQAIPTQHPAVVLRSHYTHLRILLAITMIAVIGLTVAVVILAGNDGAAHKRDLRRWHGRSDSAPAQIRVPPHAREQAAPRCPSCASRHCRTASATTADRTRAPAASPPPSRRTPATTADPKRDRADPAASPDRTTGERSTLRHDRHEGTAMTTATTHPAKWWSPLTALPAASSRPWQTTLATGAADADSDRTTRISPNRAATHPPLPPEGS